MEKNPVSTLPDSYRGADGKSHRISHILAHFKTTDLGEDLHRHVRWSIFQPTGMSNIDFQSYMKTADVNNLNHAHVMYGLTRHFIACMEPPLSPGEQELILLTSLVHDLGESIVGDINYHHKTVSHEQKEKKELQKILRDPKLVGTALSENDIQGVLDILFGDKTNKLGRIFNMIERMGYLRTGIIAWELYKKSNDQMGTNDPIISRMRQEWKKLTTEQVAQVINLLQNDTNYPYIGIFFRTPHHKNYQQTVAHVIQEILDTIPETVLDQLDQSEKKKKLFCTSKQAWNTSIYSEHVKTQTSVTNILS